MTPSTANPDLSHVLWLGGVPGIGKTTVARRIARRHGLRRYHADTRTWQHHHATKPQYDHLRVSLHYSRGPLIQNDITFIPTRPGLIVEGTSVTSDIVADPRHAVFLLPKNHDAHAHRLQQLDLTPDIMQQCLTLGDIIANDIDDTIAQTVTVTDGTTLDDLIYHVENLWGSALALVPKATSAFQRHGLIREANLQTLSQYLVYFRQPSAVGSPDTMTAVFDCECAADDCLATIDTTINDARTATLAAHRFLLAPGHRLPDLT